MGVMSKVVTFDWLKFSSPEIFYPIYFKLVGAPDWHGQSLDALYDSIVVGRINKLSPRYTLENINVTETHGTIKEFQKLVLNIFLDASIENPDIELIVR